MCGRFARGAPDLLPRLWPLSRPSGRPLELICRPVWCTPSWWAPPIGDGAREPSRAPWRRRWPSGASWELAPQVPGGAHLVLFVQSSCASGAWVTLTSLLGVCERRKMAALGQINKRWAKKKSVCPRTNREVNTIELPHWQEESPSKTHNTLA